MKFYPLFLLFSSLITACLQAQPYEKGVLKDTVHLIGTPEESFALYLPQSFDPKSPSAVIFVFDPAGRGNAGAMPFIEAAETYDIIVVCSNNSRNAAYAKNFDIAQRWFDDVFSRFNIDQNLIYAAGFSGGSRLASAIGVISGAFKGVIGCGTSFSGNPGQVPYKSDHFYYYGLVGTLDMNYQEMLNAKQWLNRMNLPNRIMTFDGKHHWPDSQEISSAFHWFRLQDINNNRSPTDQVFLESYLTTWLDKAHDMMKTQNLIGAAENYEHIINTLNPHFDLDSISGHLKQIRKTREYKKAVSERERISSLENRWTEKLVGRISLETEQESLPEDFRWWHKEMDQLHQDYIDAEKPEMKDMGLRLQSMITAVAIENLELAVSQNNSKDILYYALLMHANWPKNAYIQFRIARAYALQGKDEESLSHLKQAVNNGWTNKSWILKEKAFESLAEDKEFQLILEQIR